METKADKNNSKDEARELRKKVKRLDDSRAGIKAKNKEKAGAIKAYQDREVELKDSRDQWKAKFKEEEKRNAEQSKKLNEIAVLAEIKEEQLKKIIEEFEDLKKKHPEIYQKMRKK